jgi:hypothetical protein
VQNSPERRCEAGTLLELVDDPPDDGVGRFDVEDELPLEDDAPPYPRHPPPAVLLHSAAA